MLEYADLALQLHRKTNCPVVPNQTRGLAVQFDIGGRCIDAVPGNMGIPRRLVMGGRYPDRARLQIPFCELTESAVGYARQIAPPGLLILPNDCQEVGDSRGVR